LPNLLQARPLKIIQKHNINCLLAVYTSSLALLSDGFHNLSDVLSLGIAYWAISVRYTHSLITVYDSRSLRIKELALEDSDICFQAGEKGKSDSMTYGWKRTEVIGGLINGTFLLALALYIIMDAIPRFIEPIKLPSGYLFMIVAGAGLVINLIGTIVFAGNTQKIVRKIYTNRSKIFMLTFLV
jgi:zinc transporter 1